MLKTDVSDDHVTQVKDREKKLKIFSTFPSLLFCIAGSLTAVLALGEL